MASNTINLASIDFDTLKNDLIDFITANSTFTEHNREGSNLNLLVSILAYISNILNFNINQVANENYLQTAELRSNILKIIKVLNYNPSRKISSKVTLDFHNIITKITTSPTSTVSNLLTYDQIKSDSYTLYYIGNNVEITSSNLPDIEWVEGTLVGATDSDKIRFLGTDLPFQEYLIPDLEVGDYLNIFSIDILNNRTQWTQYEEGKIYSSPSTEHIYFVEETDKGYKIKFGNGELGRMIPTNETIGIEYIRPSGVVANLLTKFTWVGLGTQKLINSSYTDKVIDTLTYTLNSLTPNGSLGASEKETIDEIKFNAPQFFQTQGRAVTESDYSAIAVKHPLIGKAIATGGDKLVPKQLGKVYITAKPDSNNYPYPEFTQQTLDILKAYILNFSVITIEPIVQNPQYVYLVFNTLLRHHSSNKLPSIGNTKNAILDFVNNQNSDFGDYLEFSKLIKIIDDADLVTTSNITNLKMYIKVTNSYFPNTTYIRLKLPNRIYDTTQTNSTKKTYIEKVNGSNVVVATYNEDVNYSLIYEANNSYVQIHDFFPATGEPDFNNFIYKLYLFSQDDDIFLSNMQLFLVNSNEIIITTEQV